MISWIKRNKLSSILIIILLVFLGRNIISSRRSYAPIYAPSIGTDVVLPQKSVGGLSNLRYSVPEFTPSQTADRLVVKESSLSLVVQDVRGISDKITEYVKSIEGYMVSTSLTQKDEVPLATVVVRLPEPELNEALSYFRGLAVKVSSENILGTDVTDEYTDLGARLETLRKTKTKFESILDQASQIQDIINVQREIINLQDQIDAVVGRQKYLEQTAKLSKVTIYLSSDEFSLPYVPVNVFRPNVIFKLAVRSLVNTLRSVVTLLIWVVVYSVIWLPIVLAIYILRRRRIR